MRIIQYAKSLVEFVKRLSKQPPESEIELKVNTFNSDDEMMKETVRRCWNSGKVVVSSVDDNGTVTFTEHDLK